MLARRTGAPRSLVVALVGALLAVAAVALLVASFPDFDLWPLAWVGFVPLMVAVLRAPMRGANAFVLGWAAGTVFFYATCYWLTHAFIHYGGIPAALAYVLLVPGPAVVAAFPALWAWSLARLSLRYGAGRALLCAPPLWAALEWLRLFVTGQLWNAVAYSQAYQPALIQTARWGGVYLVGFLVVAVNAAVAYAVLKRDRRALAVSSAAVLAVACVVALGALTNGVRDAERPSAVVVGVQPNVPVEYERRHDVIASLMSRHLELGAGALREWEAAHAVTPAAGESEAEGVAGREGVREDTGGGAGAGRLPRVIVWPESPMNFRYSRDAGFRETVAEVARANRASVLFNAMEPAASGGIHNSAVMVNEEGRLVAQYDKIRLLPFGEYIPVPRWLPAVWYLSGVVGDFTPGSEYPLMPLGDARAGVFICFESAFPSISQKFADEGADVLVNISNDGYLGRTPVIRQHLANVVFRAVETGRPVLRVTNTGVSALVTPRGEVRDATQVYEAASRTWAVGRADGGRTFYTRQGDLFAALCLGVGAVALVTTFNFGRRARAAAPRRGRGRRTRRSFR